MNVDHCDICYSVSIGNFCSYCGRDMRKSNLPPADLDTEDGRRLFIKRESQRDQRRNKPAEHWIAKRIFVESAVP